MKDFCFRLTLLGRGLGSSCRWLACRLALLPPSIEIGVVLIIDRLVLALLVGRVLVPVLLLLGQLLLRELVILCRVGFQVSEQGGEFFSSERRGTVFEFQNERGQTIIRIAVSRRPRHGDREGRISRLD
jgi:hypothetical protein